MKTKLLDNTQGRRTYAVVLDTGDEVMAALKKVAAEEKLGGAQISAIGAFSSARLAYFDWDSKSYTPIPVNEQVEVATLAGDIAIGPDGGASVHVHAVLGKRDGSAVAGHVEEGHVRPTLEIIVTESPSHLRKRKDASSGLALIDLSK